MPFVVYGIDRVYANPVIGIFAESLVPYFKKVIIFGFETHKQNSSITYQLMGSEKITFISLGPEGKFWDHFQNKARLKNTLGKFTGKIDILLLRLPSYKAYAVWKYLNKPPITPLLFVGNSLFTSSNWYSGFSTYLFRKIRSNINDKRMRFIADHTVTLAMANSSSLADVWGKLIGAKVHLVQTSSLSSLDLLPAISSQRLKEKSIIRLLFVGRISFEKGIRELLEALSALNQNSPKKYSLDVVGAEADIGGDTFTDLAVTYNVTSMVNYHGVIPFGKDLFTIYRNSDIYILPSYHEGMPHTIWEAMSQGVPVLATPVGGVGDFFINEDDLLTIMVKDSASIVKAVRKLEQDANLLQHIIKNGLEKAAQVTCENQAKRIASLIEKLTE